MRIALRWTLIAVVGALGTVAPAGFGAVAGVQDDRLASVAIDGIEDRLDLLAASGAKVTRVDVLWSDIAPTRPAREEDPDDPAYQFAKLDLILSGLAARGIVPILSIFSAPTWATGGRGSILGRQYNSAMPNPGQYGRFVGAVALRYSRPVNPVYAVQPTARHIEVWNEPNLSQYLSPQFDGLGRSVAPRNYMRLVGAAYRRAKGANPRVVIIAGAVGPKSRTRKRGAGDVPGHGALDWIRGMRANRSLARFDAFSQHIYPAQPPRSPRVVMPNWASIPTLLQEIDRIRPGLRLYITEAGYTTQPTPIRTSSVTLAQQARYLRDIFNLPAVRSRRVPAVIWFNLQDNPAWPAGLLRADLTPKPSRNVFETIARRGTLPPELRP